MATIYHRDDGTGGISDAMAEYHINGANEYFKKNGVSIFLYLICSPIHYNWTARSEPSYANTDDIMEDAVEAYPNVMNISFVTASTDFGGVAELPHGWGGYKRRYSAIVCTNGGVAYTDLTITHEIGHALGLFHTHNSTWPDEEVNATVNICKQEPVSRTAHTPWYCGSSYFGKACERNGDLLCDTHADPGMEDTGISDPLDSVNVPRDCIYNYTGTNVDRIRDKLHGTRWDSPDGYNAYYNIMSYAEAICRRQFTPDQTAVMYYFTERYKKTILGIPVLNPVTFYENKGLDVYENDNYFQNAKFYDILHPRRQHRTFHSVINPVSNQPQFCDTDWVRFKIESSRRVIIRTSEVPGKPKPNTILSLFGTADISVVPAVISVVIHTDDNPSSNFSKLDVILPAGDYLVRVQNTETLADMNYFLTLSLDREFDDFGIGFSGLGGVDLLEEETDNVVACVGDQFTASGVPEGCEAVWSSETPGLYISSSGLVLPATSTYINTINGGNGFEAQIRLEVFCDGQTLPSTTISFSLWVGPLVKPTIEIVHPVTSTTGHLCLNSGNYLQATTSGVYPDEYEWNVVGMGGGSSGTYFTDNTLTLPEFSASTAWYHIKVRARNRCGWSPWSSLMQVSVTMCSEEFLPGGGRMASLAPNPAQNQVTVTVRNEIPIAQGGLDIRIKDMYGLEKIAVQSQTRETSLDISTLSVGIYIVYVQNGSKIEYLRLNVE